MKKLIAKIYLSILSIAILVAIVYFGKQEAVYFIIGISLVIITIWALCVVYANDKGVN